MFDAGMPTWQVNQNFQINCMRQWHNWRVRWRNAPNESTGCLSWLKVSLIWSSNIFAFIADPWKGDYLLILKVRQTFFFLDHLLDQVKLFFDEEFEMEKQICREGICTSKAKELSKCPVFFTSFPCLRSPSKGDRCVSFCNHARRGLSNSNTALSNQGGSFFFLSNSPLGRKYL